MSFTQTAIGGTILAGIATAALQFAAQEPPVLVVHSLDYANGEISASRTVTDLEDPMDWEVTVFRRGDGAPVCTTKKGPEEHQGWAYYRQGYAAFSMDLDRYVGDVGCLDRLSSGQKYGLTVVWTPRDGRDAVSAYLSFTAE